MKANVSISHLLVNKKDEVDINLGEAEIKNSEHKKYWELKLIEN